MSGNSTSTAIPPPPPLTSSSSSRGPTTLPTTPPPPPPPPTSQTTPPPAASSAPTPTTPNAPETVTETVSPSSGNPVVVIIKTSTKTTPATVPGQATSPTSISVSTTDPSATDSLATQQPVNTSAAGSGNGGLNGTTKVVVAVVVPIIGVALIAIALLFLWKRRQQTKADAEARRKEVEEYGYNPNNDPHGGAAAAAGVGVARSNSNEETLYEMTESDAAGYRGWGSTNGGRKASNMGSSVGTTGPLSPVGMAFSDGGFPQQQGNAIGSGPDGYTGVATSPSASTFPTGNSPSVDGNSNAPLIHGNRPNTADSSVIGAMNGPVTADNSGGIHRGISNASSNYSAMTQSDQSDLGQPLSHHDAQYYGVDDGYEDAYYSSRNPVHPYSGDNGYGPAPVIRDVSARRNTRIETPTNTHFPQQGNSGIAQNF